MFDGIDHCVLFMPDLDECLGLYRDLFGFVETAAYVVVPPSPYHAAWGLPEVELDVRDLIKPGAAGGGLRLVGCVDLPAPTSPRTLGRPGPFALDFYVRDLPALVDRLQANGHRLRSRPVRYELAGAGFEVDEVLLEAPLGFVHALVEYLPGRHRCVLGDDPSADVSEVVAAITVTDDVDEGLATLRDGLGGQVYFDAPFEGPAVEELIGLPAGTSFRAVLLRGPERRNARAELMAAVPDAGRREGTRSHPYLALSCAVPDVDALADALSDPRHGELHGPFAPEAGPWGGRRAVVLWSRWGAVLELVEGSGRAPDA